jgi:hypothetical protein
MRDERGEGVARWAWEWAWERRGMERESAQSTRETSRVFDIDRRKGRRRKQSTQDHPQRHGEEHQQVSSAGMALPVGRRQVPDDQHPEPRRRPQQMLLSAEKQVAASRHARRCGCFASFLLLGCTARGTLRDCFGTPTQHRRCRGTVAADGCTEAMRAHLRPPLSPRLSLNSQSPVAKGVGRLQCASCFVPVRLSIRLLMEPSGGPHPLCQAYNRNRALSTTHLCVDTDTARLHYAPGQASLTSS